MIDPLPEGDALITSRQARELAGNVSVMTLWRWQRAGVIPDPIQIRSRNYWRRGEFTAALIRAGRRG